ncbi:hypothetical protein SAMN02745166_05034 [Prosthecobacter debontii]|uniref:Uncharacterized protein n=1 Tax=Prosthecobacter debontii TaxID=48467 RepID=A0A1T4Z5J7_9BACT|nr:hypothetical protein [Prosthecobacter debontii]SKB08805.1 hypothetical protein SAMN02745166_05034 [Prosthecobacter debontii]
MNLREQLRNILPDILPHDPEEAIKGTELIRLVRLRLGDDYSDATLRYHFSILSYDSTSPIAKVDQGQGYYQRVAKPVSATGTGRLLFGGEAEGDVQQARFLRVLTIYERLCLLRSHYPFRLNGRADLILDERGFWDIPDIISAEWDLETGADEVTRFDSGMLDLRRHLGGPEVSLSGVQLKIGLTLDNYMAEFFQALSSTRWTLQSELVIAEPLNDEALVDALRSLGNQFGVGISSLGINSTQLDELPAAKELRAMSAAEFEMVQGKLRIQRITVPAPRLRIDWQALSTLRKKHEAVDALVHWLSVCLERRQPEWK